MHRTPPPPAVSRGDRASRASRSRFRTLRLREPVASRTALSPVAHHIGTAWTDPSGSIVASTPITRAAKSSATSGSESTASPRSSRLVDGCDTSAIIGRALGPAPACIPVTWVSAMAASVRAKATRGAGMDWKLELIAVPVTDVDRAKAFYTDKAGFNADHDIVVSDEIRFVQLTPPGSACSIALGKGVTDAAPGSVQGMQMVVPDIEDAHAELAGRGVEVSDVQDFPWGRFVFFSDPDGNRWAVQQLPPRDGS